MENLWEMIAKSRGVAINEVFKWNDLAYKITDYDGLLVLDCSSSWVMSGRTHGFIKGEGKIERVPFVPKMGEKYWTCDYGGNEPYIGKYIWNNGCYDKERKLLGIVFRTKQDASDYLPTWKKRLEDEEC